MNTRTNNINAVYEEFNYRMKELKEFANGVRISRLMAETLNVLSSKETLTNSVQEIIKMYMPNAGKEADNRKYEILVCRQIIVTTYTIFVDYILNILKELYLSHPDILVADGKKDKESQTMEELVNTKISKMSYESIEIIINKLKLFNPSFKLDEQILYDVINLSQIRNIIVHNKGIVDEVCIKKCKGEKIKLEKGSEYYLSYADFFELDQEDRTSNKIALIERIGEMVYKSIN